MEINTQAVNSNLLHKLRDIHLPDPVSFYPLPLAWWIMFFITGLLIVGFWFFLQYKLKATQRKALKQLDILEAELKDHPDHEFIYMELSYLLKNYVRQQFPNTFASSLIDQKWLIFLDKTSDSKNFSQGVGNALRNLPYQNKTHKDGLEIFDVVRLWIKKNPYKTKKKIVV